MKKNRILSALLCLSLAAGLVIPGLPAYAEGEGESSNSGMELSKTAVAKSDGTYTITLEAYATGQKVINKVDKDVPTDIILVLDQSGSMEWDIGTVNYGPYQDIDYGIFGTEYHTRNRDHYEKRHNGGEGNLYYFDENTSAYYPVSVSVVKIETPVELGNLTNSGYWNYSNDNLYEKVGEEYQPVSLTREWIQTGFFGWDGYYQYTYTFSDGKTITSNYNDSTPNLGSHAPLYTITVDDSQNVYTYTYVDADDNTQTIDTSIGANTVFETTLFQKVTDTNGGGSRLAALQDGVKQFAQSVATKAAGADGQLGTKDDINHRLALVGFASGNNTELLSIAGNNSGSVGVAYGNISNQNLKDVLQNMNTTAGQTMVTNAINALAANGATRVDLGMDMAQRILTANPVPEGQQRNRVVVVFTDGAPTSSNGFERSVANEAISKANAIKSNGATVYSVGIFPGADPTSSGTEPGGDLGQNSSSLPAAGNWFMQNLSSNNGKPQTPSYYLSAADAATLTSIFQQISDNIETGGSSTTLNETAVIKDIISPAFALPAGATASNITLETYKCTGKSGDAYTWTKNPTAMGATAAVNGDQVSVTGFDFADNYVGTVTENGNTTYRGNKLVISFTVSPKAGFLGGNNVYTNTSAGVYENANAATPVLEFNRPQVNVPIKKVTVDAVDKDVYLLSDVDLDALKNGSPVKVGDVTLDLSADNYGLDTWQNEYVDITVQITDKDGKVISSDLSDLTDDTTYTVTVTVSPKTNGTGASGTAATEKSGSGAINIKVYKPELTYQDSEVFYGETVPTNFDTYNRTATKWKHDGTEADTTKMGDAPTLTITYTPEADKTTGNKINSKDDIQVKATVKIGSEDVTTYTIFAHTACAEGVTCGWNETTLDGDPAFLLHVKTASLIINKTGADGNKNEGFIFNVTGPNNLTFRVSVKDNGSVKITGLPLGTYTVTEDEGWSWRYTATGSAQAELTKAKPDGAVTIQNAKDNSYLLDGSAYAQNNSVRPAAGN